MEELDDESDFGFTGGRGDDILGRVKSLKSNRHVLIFAQMTVLHNPFLRTPFASSVKMH